MTNSVTWQSPSNIALVKYWGKKPVQLPTNASISFTLKNCHTTTTLSWEKAEKTNRKYNIQLYLDGELKNDFTPKIEKFFDNIEHILPFVKTHHFKVETSNSFPHSSGIASSASGMSALALCLCSMEKELGLAQLNEHDFFKKASLLARLGSGSACRSIYSTMAIWGEHDVFEKSTNEYAIPYTDIHPVFQSFQDTILLVDKGQKEVSSSLGHSLMNNHPFANQRFIEADTNMHRIKDVLVSGDLIEFRKIVEEEALMLHAMMMTSSPYFLLFKPNTLHIIEKIWQYRNQNRTNFVVTLDAGANVHFLYPKAEKEAAMSLINNELIVYCENNAYICDEVGHGPVKL